MSGHMYVPLVGRPAMQTSKATSSSFVKSVICTLPVLQHDPLSAEAAGTVMRELSLCQAGSSIVSVQGTLRHWMTADRAHHLERAWTAMEVRLVLSKQLRLSSMTGTGPRPQPSKKNSLHGITLGCSAAV